MVAVVGHAQKDPATQTTPAGAYFARAVLLHEPAAGLKTGELLRNTHTPVWPKI